MLESDCSKKHNLFEIFEMSDFILLVDLHRVRSEFDKILTIVNSFIYFFILVEGRKLLNSLDQQSPEPSIFIIIIFFDHLVITILTTL